ncbi:kinesin-like protein KIF13B, partial [Nematolebias whitei]|uniref:kinesin-like protein KIF13B n=1 Tax=Nematolebias whitei TaxID=451745 RepID=UPI0018983C8A
MDTLAQGRWESQQDIFMPSQFHRTLPRPASSPSTYSTSLSSSSTSFISPPPQNQEPEQVKALVPQMPKLLKSLFPARDDKKELRPSPHSQQQVPRIMTSSVGDDNKAKSETAAVLRPPAKDRRTEFPDVPPLPVHDPHDTTPLSPLSQSSSGYFST